MFITNKVLLTISKRSLLTVKQLLNLYAINKQFPKLIKNILVVEDEGVLAVLLNKHLYVICAVLCNMINITVINPDMFRCKVKLFIYSYDCID